MIAALIAAAFIVRIVAVRDTRDVIEDGDRFVPVPGTGVLRACDRCGRTHEIHVDVLLSDGTSATLGAGCARGESMEIQAKIKGAVSAAKTRAKLAAQVVSLRAQRDAYAVIAAEVEALPLPAIVEAAAPSERQTAWEMGDAGVWSFDGLSDERRRALTDSWRANRIRERTDLRAVPAHVIVDLEDRIAKIDRKIASFCGAAS